MRSEIAQEIASGPHAAAFDSLAQVYTADDLDGLLLQIAKARNGMADFLDEATVRVMFGVSPNESMSAILQDVFRGQERDFIDRILPHLNPADRNEGSWLKKLQALPQDICNEASLKVLETLVLSGVDTKNPSAAKVGKFPNVSARAALGDKLGDWDAFMLRVEAARPRRTGLAAALKTAALHGFARHFIPMYEARKAAQGMLDFDDQIFRARELLHDPAVAQWVLYRLDGGIDHILVDEAQDTSPDQWQVLERLTDAFMDSSSARNRARTIFVVGDKKQSIYSFQGADVAAFDAMKQRFRRKLGEVRQELQEQDMLHSFRSSPAILSVVDATFDHDDTASVGGKMRHLAFFDQMPGRVEVWPLIESQSATEDEDGFSPVDLTTDEHHAVRMGKKVAAWIADALKVGMQVPTREGQRQANAGDFLVLVRRRSKIFDAVISACKQHRLPVAGADRLVLGDELAAKDLMALLSFLATDTDDLSLAVVLRSPLGGLTEDELYRLAFARECSLWLRLEDQAASHLTVYSMLKALRSEVELLRPYDLLEKALTRHGGRLRLVARLGQECEDAIDELLTQALAYESTEVPSITGFLSWLTAGDVQVKRQMDSGGASIRVMTVHGAKGLEAPVVILPDTADYTPPDRDEVFKLTVQDPPGGNHAAEDLVVWSTQAEDSPTLIRAEKARRKERQAHEDDRLLYVAMTRAQSVLIVGAAGKIGKNSVCWHRKVSAGMDKLGAAMDADGRLVHSFGIMPASRLEAMPIRPDASLPDWAKLPAPPQHPVMAAFNPSSLGGAKALPGDGGLDLDVAMARGAQLHLLLENLPAHDPAAWAAVARVLGAEDQLEDARRVIARHPGLFHAETLAEVPLTAALAGKRILGVIDRLVIENERILAVDFKSNRVVPRSVAEVPEGILRQMGAYADALAQIYPQRRIDTAILWTQTAELMVLDPEIVRAALQRALSLDVSAPSA
jgi:ATP-dependent helicase/nuclease subunit A